MWSDVGNWSRSFWRSFRWLSLPNKQNLDATKSQNSRYIEWSLYLSWSVWLLVRLTYMCSPKNQCELSVLVVSHVSCFYQPCIVVIASHVVTVSHLSCDCLPCQLWLQATSVVIDIHATMSVVIVFNVSWYCYPCMLWLQVIEVVIASHFSCDWQPCDRVSGQCQLFLSAMSVVTASHVSGDCISYKLRLLAMSVVTASHFSCDNSHATMSVVIVFDVSCNC